MKKLIALSLLIVLSSCRTAKKEWVESNFAQKQLIEALEKKISKSKLEITENVSKSLITDFDKILKKYDSNLKESRETLTTISGTLTAEDGQQKSVTAGGLNIVSNGATVTFKTSETTNYFKEVLTQIDSLKEDSKTKEVKISDLKKELDVTTEMYTHLQDQINTIQTTRTKQVKKSGGTFGFTSMLIIVAVIVVLGFVFRSRLKMWVK